MQTDIELELQIAPEPWQRARRKKDIYFDIQEKKKETYAWMAKSKLPTNFLPYNEAIAVMFDFRVPIPASYSLKKRKEMHHQFCYKKPDLSNFIKFIEDALTGILWHDDRIIVQIYTRKVYDFNPRVLLGIKKINGKI